MRTRLKRQPTGDYVVTVAGTNYTYTGDFCTAVSDMVDLQLDIASGIQSNDAVSDLGQLVDHQSVIVALFATLPRSIMVPEYLVALTDASICCEYFISGNYAAFSEAMGHSNPDGLPDPLAILTVACDIIERYIYVDGEISKDLGAALSGADTAPELDEQKPPQVKRPTLYQDDEALEDTEVEGVKAWLY